MKTFSAILSLILLAGCASPKDVTQAKLLFQHGTNTISITQPKDLVIDGMEFDPASGKLRLTGYRSTANADAVEASKVQLQSQWAAIAQFVTLMQMGAAAFGKSQGIDMSSAIPTNRPAQITVPEGYKLVPKDDPSYPRWMMPDPGSLLPGPSISITNPFTNPYPGFLFTYPTNVVMTNLSIPFGALTITSPPTTYLTNGVSTNAHSILFNTITPTNTVDIKFFGPVP